MSVVVGIYHIMRLKKQKRLSAATTFCLHTTMLAISLEWPYFTFSGTGTMLRSINGYVSVNVYCGCTEAHRNRWEQSNGQE